MTIPVFPSVTALPGITFPVKSTVVWNTVKHEALSGKRIRLGNWTYPIRRWDLPISTLRTASNYLEWQTLIGFINSVLGAALVWAYSDPLDNAVVNQPFGEGDGTTTTFQLVRTLGGFAEPVFLAQFGATFPTVSVNGTPTQNYVISPTGLITFAAAPGAGAALTWSGSFWWPVRFDDDETDLSQFLVNIVEAKSLKFSSEKLDTTTGGVGPNSGGTIDLSTGNVQPMLGGL
jgi:uncharacterized protein (TIGR02217 family)